MFEGKCYITDRKLIMKPSLTTIRFSALLGGHFLVAVWALGRFLGGLTFEDKCCITERKLSMKPSPATIRSLT